MSNWIGQTGPWLAGFSAWNLIQLKSRSCWAWFFSGTWGCGGAGPGFEITWFLTEFSCLQIQDRGPFFVPDIRWESRLSLRGCPQFFAMWLPFPKAVHKMTFWFFSCARRTLFSLTFPSIPVSYKSLIWWDVTTGVIPYDHFPCIITRILTCSAVFNSLRTHGLQLSRLLCPWNFPGKNTGVGCHFLLQGFVPTRPRDWTSVSCFPCIGRQICSHWVTWEAPAS